MGYDPNDLFAQSQEQEAKPESYEPNMLFDMAKDIPGEVGKSLSTNIGGMAQGLDPRNRAEKGVVGGTLEAGSGLLHGLATIPDVIQSPLRSIIGHPMAAAERYTGKAIGKSLQFWFPGTEAAEVGKRIAATAEAEEADPKQQREHYEKSAEGVTTALGAARPKGFSPGLYEPGQTGFFGPRKIGPIHGRELGMPKQIPPMETDQLWNLSDNLFREARQSGVVVKPTAVQSAVKNIVGEMRAEGFRDVPHSGSAAYGMLTKLIEEPDLINPASGGYDVGGIHSIMKGLRRIGQSQRGTSEGDAALMAMHGLRDFMYDLPKNPGNVMMGHNSVPQAMADLQRATAIWHTASKADTVEEAVANAFLQAKSSGAGANIENTLRQAIKSILRNPGRRRGFSSEEINQMHKIVTSDKKGEMLRLLGKLAPTGVISGLGGVEIGHLLGLGGWKMLLPSAVGHVARKASEARKIAQAEQLGELIRGKVTQGVTTRLPPHLEFTKKRLFDPRVMAPFLSQFQHDDQKQPFLRDAQGNEYE